MNPPSLKITMRNNMPELADVAEQLRIFMRSVAIPQKMTYVISLSFEEMVSNIIKYGYDDELTHEISVCLSCDGDSIKLRLADDGHPFDPLSVKEPDTGASISERDIGGLGIHLVKEMADSVDYKREGGLNILDISVSMPSRDEGEGNNNSVKRANT